MTMGLPFSLENLRVRLGQPHVPIRVTPTQVISVDPQKLRQHQGDIRKLCNSIPNAAGSNWQILRVYTNGDGDLAKLLIALGELLGVWIRHPPLDVPAAWSNPYFPSIYYVIPERDSMNGNRVVGSRREDVSDDDDRLHKEPPGSPASDTTAARSTGRPPHGQEPPSAIDEMQLIQSQLHPGSRPPSSFGE